MSVKLTQDRILIEPDETEKQTTGGIFLPSATEENTVKGTVLDTGEGMLTKSGKLVPVQIQVGDRVLYMRDTGDKVVLDSKELVILSEQEILAVLDD